MKYSGSLYFYNDETEQEFELEIEFRYYADMWQIVYDDNKPDWVTYRMIDEAFDEQLPRLLEKEQDDYYEE